MISFSSKIELCEDFVFSSKIAAFIDLNESSLRLSLFFIESFIDSFNLISIFIFSLRYHEDKY